MLPSIATLLEQDISNGFLAPGTKLPPQRELADFLDLNFTTITRAYKICERRGLIYATTGSGTFVSPNAARSITISTESSKNTLDLSFVASFEQTNELVVEAIQKVVSKSYVPFLQIQLVPIVGDASGMLTEELEKHCSQMKIHGVFLMPSCINPTTIMMSDRRKREIAEVIRKYQLILIEDDIHAFLTAGIIEGYKQLQKLPLGSLQSVATYRDIRLHCPDSL